MLSDIWPLSNAVQKAYCSENHGCDIVNHTHLIALGSNAHFHAHMKPSQIPKEKRVFVRTSSDEWEVPSDENKRFAEIVNDKKQFRAKIHLNNFDSFDKDEIDVYLHNYDVQIHACRLNPNNPNRALRVLTRQYRLPSDIDLSTITLKRNKSREEVDVKANKIPERGLLIGLNIVDATTAGKKVRRIQAF